MATAVVSGSLTLDVSDPEAFVADEEAKDALAKSVAKLVGVPASQVTIKLAVVTRRLSFIDIGRLLQSGGSVIVTYKIELPPQEQSVLNSEVDSIQAAISDVKKNQMTNLITNELGSDSLYTVEVTAIDEPDVEVVVIAPAPTVNTESDEGVSTEVIVVVVVVIALCAGGALAIGGIYWHKAKQTSGKVMDAPDPSVDRRSLRASGSAPGGAPLPPPDSAVSPPEAASTALVERPPPARRSNRAPPPLPPLPQSPLKRPTSPVRVVVMQPPREEDEFQAGTVVYKVPEPRGVRDHGGAPSSKKTGGGEALGGLWS